MADAQATVETFILPLEPGSRFCLLYRPPTGMSLRGGVIYVHPFAEEMNKSRRMAAMMSRQFAHSGYAVLQMDLFGCGDSSGEMKDATIAIWRSDIQAAADWMLDKGFGPLTLWGLRLGALLAADWSRQTRTAHDRLLLWQPVASGELHLSQFLRIGVASDMLSSTNSGAGVRKRLAEGQSVEVAGYDITPVLAQELSELRMVAEFRDGVAVDWCDVSNAPGNELGPASKRLLESMRANGVAIEAQLVNGDPFWSTVEIVDCPALIDATIRLASERWTPSSASAA